MALAMPCDSHRDLPADGGAVEFAHGVSVDTPYPLPSRRRGRSRTLRVDR